MTVDEQNTDSAIPELRRRFEEEYAENIASGLYDSRDITRLQTDDAYAGCFIRHVMNDVSAAVSLTHTSLKWRKEMEINDLSETSFPRWVHDLSAMYYHNVDKEGRPVLIFHVARCKKDSEKHRLQKQYIAWIFEKHFIRHLDERVVVCFDMTGAGISNMDVELIKFQVTCFTTYYPSFLAYMLVFDMPWILNTIWRVIRTLLNEAQQKAVIFVKGEEILGYIERDQLLKIMGGTDTFEYKYLPTETSLLSIADSDSGDASTPDGDGSSSGTKKKVTFAQEDDTVVVETANKTRKTRLRRRCKGPRRPGDGSVYHGPLLTVSPAEEFVFELADEQKEAVDVLTLCNCTEKLVAYKVKTTSPASYRVRPSSGLIKTQASANINIVLLPGCHLTANEDRFLLMAMTVDEDVTSSSPRLKELWQEKTLGGDTNYMEHRLGCTLQLGSSVDPDTVDGDTEDNHNLGQRMSQLSTQINSVLQSQRELMARVRWLLVINVLLFLIIVLLLGAAIHWRVWSTTQPISESQFCHATSPVKLTSDR